MFYGGGVKRLIATLSLSGLVLAGCSSVVDSIGETTSAPDTSEGPTLEIPAGLESFYTQDVEWGNCETMPSTAVECARITVPLDYDNPDGKTIELAVRRTKDDGSKKPLLVNPGGPGASGQDLASNATAYFSPKLLDSYQIIGFDPRGVAESSPLECMGDEDLGRLADASYPDTPEGEEQSIKDAQFIVDSCQDNGGDLLPFIGTVSAAKDMDVIRALVGNGKMDYLGFSYGTHLGAQYADLFPENVGHMVLDGAIDPAVSSIESSHFQAMGFELALTNYITYCLEDSDCPLEGSTVDEAKAFLRDKIEATLDNPIPTTRESRPLTQSEFYTGIATPLYDNSSWDYLTEGLRRAIESNDGTLLQMFADLMIGRDSNTGNFLDNSLQARWAINCVDFPKNTNKDEWEAANEKLREDAPTFAPFFENSEALCSLWPYTAGEIPGPFVAEGSEPILVIGTKGDPATPYQSAVHMADQLDNGILISYEGEGHTAYNRSGSCVTSAVDNYFVDGTVPDDGLTCPVE